MRFGIGRGMLVEEGMGARSLVCTRAALVPAHEAVPGLVSRQWGENCYLGLRGSHVPRPRA